MRKYAVLLLVLVFLTVSFGAAGQRDERRKTAEQLAAEQAFTEGIAYALPRNGLIVSVEVQSESFKPGPYAQFAKKHLGIDGVKSTESVIWRMTGMDVTQFSEPDPDAIFKIADSYPVAVSILPNGVIYGINTKGNVPGIQVIGSSYFVSPDKKAFDFTDLSSDDFYDLNIDQATGRETMVQKSLEEKAREAADYIMRLRKKRSYKIISPSDMVPEDGKGYEVFVNEARRLEEAYTALFTGKTAIEKHTFSFIFIPGEANVRNEVIFRFSEDKGVLPKTDLSGKPVFLALTKEQEAFNTISKLKNSDNPKAGKNGLYYRIPCGASVSITDGINTLYAGRTVITQFGSIAPVPQNLHDGEYQIIYNTETGTIKSISKKE